MILDAKNLTTLDGGKYTIVQHSDGRLEALRYGETWRDLTGDNLFLALLDAYEASARDAVWAEAYEEICAVYGRNKSRMWVLKALRKRVDQIAARHATQGD